MALGAVALGYGHPEVNQAVIEAVARGGIGPVSPMDEVELAAELGARLPGVDSIRFLKTGAEAVAAAVRLARAATGRDRIIGCGYHGWLDWCSDGPGVPRAVRALYDTLPFNDPERSREQIRLAGDGLAAVVIEPVIDAAPDPEWLGLLRAETRRVGALLIYDEIKTAFRVDPGGAARRWGGEPDLLVLGKALANGYPLAAVAGPDRVMQQIQRTWISSTTATEFVSLAAARATLRVAAEQHLSEHLARVGRHLFEGLERLADTNADRIAGVAGIPEMCYLRYHADEFGKQVAVQCARRGLLFKRNAYNFVSLAHGDGEIQQTLAVLGEVLEATR
jgi:glutamate-1-semialdehyde aminotransferase